MAAGDISGPGVHIGAISGAVMPGIGIGVWLTSVGSAAPGPNQIISGTATVSSRTGFISPLVEFGGGVCPEQEDNAVVSLQFAESGGTVSSGTLVMGRPVWIQSADLSGTYTPGTGALSVTGTCGALAVAVTATYGSITVTGTITITNGAHEETRTFSCTFGTAVSLPTGTVYYVDSVNGNDGNAGTGPDVPFQTIGAVDTAIGDTAWSSAHVLLASGSAWSEDAGGGGTGSIIERYSVGPRPLIQCADTIGAGSWSKTAGRTYVYQCTFTPDTDASDWVFGLEDGVGLLGVADQATCDSTAGSIVIQATSGAGPYTIYIHPYGDTDPTSDGKTYELSSRTGLYLLGNSELRGLHVRASIAQQGGAAIKEASAPGTDAGLIDDCVASWCNKHHFFLQSGNFTRCVVSGWLCVGTTASFFIVNRTTPTSANVADLYDCAALQLSGAPTYVGGTFYGSHYNTSGTFGAMTIRSSGVANANNIGQPNHCTSFAVSDCIFEDITTGGVTGSPTGDTVWERSRVYNINVTCSSLAVIDTTVPSFAANDCLFVGIQSTYPFTLRCADITFTRCLWQDTDPTPAGNVLTHNNGAYSPGWTRNNCVFLDCKRIDQNQITAEPDYLAAADYNVVNPADATHSQMNLGTNYTSGETWAAYLLEAPTIAAGWDANSTTTRPTYIGTTDTGSRPTFEETSASLTSRGYAAGPVGGAPGTSTPWVTPSTYAAWYAFIASL